MRPRSTKPSFAGRALPFLALISVGSWGLSQFLKLPTQLSNLSLGLGCIRLGP